MLEVTAAISVVPSHEEMFEQAVAMNFKLSEQLALVEDTRTLYPDAVKDLWDAELWVSSLVD